MSYTFMLRKHPKHAKHVLAEERDDVPFYCPNEPLRFERGADEHSLTLEAPEEFASFPW